MKFASLGSGSEGNALLVSAGTASPTIVMVDCGFGLRETERRLARLGLEASALSAIVVTHEHGDHVGGVFKLARRYGLPVWMSYGTWKAIENKAEGVDIRFCRDGTAFTVDQLEMLPYTVPHDAREPLQFVATDGVHRLGVLTDAGHPTPHLLAALHGCDAMLLECNHDRQLLADSPYPPSLKSRIGGPYGHLSNEHSAEILASLDRSRLNKVVCAHLSRQNNTPVLVREAVDAVVANEQVDVLIACQDEGFGWLDCHREAIGV
ncbi:MAG: MBL fold metallo-hydrolase [Burkholderiaceae bacterium]